MFRAEVLWISVFLAIGAVGGLVYNWPSESDVGVETPVVLQPAPVVESGAEVGVEPLVSGEVVGTADAEAAVRENPQAVQAGPGAVTGISLPLSSRI